VLLKNYLKLALVIFLTVTFSELEAQVKPGYIFGLNLSTATLKGKGISSDPKVQIGIHYGGFIEVPLNYNFTLQPGLLFSAKGSNYKIDGAEVSISPIYIEVPVIVVYSFGSDAVKVSLFTGSYFAYGMGGYKIQSGGELKSINFGSGETSDLKSFDIGLIFGIGVNIKGLLFSANYGIGLADISPETSVHSEMKNKVIGISLCSLFGTK
jgi:Outer membrane protein beta-barrel domain